MSTATPRYRDSPASGARKAYARLARYYDFIFGPLLARARLAGVRAVNALPGRDVLEVGVGTGLALPRYHKGKCVTGIDFSMDMLSKARRRVARLRLSQVEAVLEMDAQDMAFGDAQFDIAVAMFVASVVPEPRALLKEMRRVVKPGGTLLFVNHFAAAGAPARRNTNPRKRGLVCARGWRGGRARNQSLIPARHLSDRVNELAGWYKRLDRVTEKLGWRSGFRLEDIFTEADLATARCRRLGPFGMFQLVELRQPGGSPVPGAADNGAFGD